MRPKLRKPKLNASDVLGQFKSNSSDSEDTTSEEEYDSDAKPPPMKVRKVVSLRIEGHNELIPEETTWEESEAKIAFCCAKCFCSEQIKGQIPYENAFVQSSDDGLFHRRCCHGLIDDPYDDWLCQYENAMHKAEETLLESYGSDSSDKEYPQKRWKKYLKNHWYKHAKRYENEIYNSDGQVDPAQLALTCPDYTDNNLLFDKIAPKESGAVVLDMFAGIGSGIVALKRLGIKIQTIIHVEHDPVASHVYRWNHDCSYNMELPADGIKHIYFEKFETVEKKKCWKKLLKDHGPLDIIIGGPPCVDYSKANANRRGADGEQGGFMLRFGKLVRRIKKVQQRMWQHHVFFLGENTKLDNAKQLPYEDGDLEQVKKAFGVSWSIELDAQSFSPGRRNRTFLSNIPFFTKNQDYIDDEEAEDCLQDNFQLPGHCVEKGMTVKANCFMAHKSRLDDSPRMDIFKEVLGMDGEVEKYVRRTFNVQERENIMGFPSKYVEGAVNELFEQLLQNGYGCVVDSTPYWKSTLPEKYHHFGGRQIFQFLPKFPVELCLAPPGVEGKKSVEYYSKEQYSKRLIGNSFSIPVVEVMLRMLQSKFPTQHYENYNYSFAWLRQPNGHVVEALGVSGSEVVESLGVSGSEVVEAMTMMGTGVVEASGMIVSDVFEDSGKIGSEIVDSASVVGSENTDAAKGMSGSVEVEGPGLSGNVAAEAASVIGSNLSEAPNLIGSKIVEALGAKGPELLAIEVTGAPDAIGSVVVEVPVLIGSVEAPDLIASAVAKVQGKADSE